MLGTPHQFAMLAIHCKTFSPIIGGQPRVAEHIVYVLWDVSCTYHCDIDSPCSIHAMLMPSSRENSLPKQHTESNCKLHESVHLKLGNCFLSRGGGGAALGEQRVELLSHHVLLVLNPPCKVQKLYTCKYKD